jgi:hypothetical protein
MSNIHLRGIILTDSGGWELGTEENILNLRQRYEEEAGENCTIKGLIICAYRTRSRNEKCLTDFSRKNLMGGVNLRDRRVADRPLKWRYEHGEGFVD